jgi:uncharacterized protein (DUF2141 family)
MGAWLGLRDEAGQVTRLVFNSKEEFSNKRQFVNRQVVVTGLPLPPDLGRPQIQVIAIVTQP